MKKSILAALVIIALVSLFISGCEKGSEIVVPQNITSTITIDYNTILTAEQCKERNLDDKIIMIWSEKCGACHTEVPKLRELEQELSVNFTFIDVLKPEDISLLNSFKISPRYTPTVLVGCDVFIGQRSKQAYNSTISAFLNRSIYK